MSSIGKIHAHDDEVYIHLSSVSSTYDPATFASNLNNLNAHSKYKMSVGSMNTDENMVDGIFKTMKEVLMLVMHMMKNQRVSLLSIYLKS